MAHDGQDVISGANIVIDDLLATTRSTLAPVDRLLEAAKSAVRATVSQDGKVSNTLVEENQTAAHGLAWLATYAQSLHQMQLWAEKLDADGTFSETEQLIHQIAFGEYLCQISGGIQMNQGEILRLHDLGVSTTDQNAFSNAGITTLQQRGNSQAARTRLVELMQEQSANITVGRSGLDEELEMIREQFRRYAVEKVEPFAHEWHLKDELIPIEVINELAEMGVFGLTIPEEFGGFGLSKASMCVVSEELSRGYIGVGSLGTRSEIAAELIIAGGTDAQKEKWLPRIASAETLPTAVFTEPNTGSDLGSLRTRAVKDGDDYKITGNKTWITHAARTHVMTLLARTDPQTSNYKGLSMFLAEKTPGDDANPFPSEGMTGGEIEVLGYRGMKEYELGFDGFHVKGENLLGGEEGKGFKQLMETFESARIQTAARAIGVAQSALDISMQYAIDRKQFGKSLINFPRVSSKLAMMAVEIMIARQLTYFSAFEKDEGRRCDVEAGMAHGSLGPQLTMACRSMAATVLHSSTKSAVSYVTHVSSTFSKARQRFRRRSSRAVCSDEVRAA